MKILIYALTLCSLLALASCEIETSSHGPLYAFWHLERIDSVGSGAQLDTKPQRLFWSFQANLLQLDDKDGTHPSLLMRFEHNGNTLRLYDPYLYNREEGDEPLDTAEPLKPFGINTTDETFAIESLGSGKMVLLSPTVRLHFRQF